MGSGMEWVASGTNHGVSCMKVVSPLFENLCISGYRLSMSTIVCEIPSSLQEQLKEFRFRKATGSAALIIKIKKEQFVYELDQALQPLDNLQHLAEELPDHQPRYVVLSYEYRRDDGRVSYPLVFFYYCPQTVKPETNMLYAGAKMHLVHACDCGKVYDVRAPSELSDTWLREKLSFFK